MNNSGKTKDKNTVTVGPKYQVVLPKSVRRVCRGLKAGATVRVYPLDECTVAVTLTSKSWAEENKGGLKDVWSGIDTDKQLKKIRDEWETKI